MKTIAMDLDGTLVSYGNGPIQANQELIDQVVWPGDEVIIVTNQGGIALGYRTVANFIERIAAAKSAIEARGATLVWVSIGLWHPRATQGGLKGTEEAIRLMLPLVLGDKSWHLSALPKFRKPSGLMLSTLFDLWDFTYCGDSDEDEGEAAAAGVPFVRVERFMGGEG